MQFTLRGSVAPIATARARFLTGSAVLFLALQAGNALSFINQAVMSRMLAPSEYGELVTLSSVSYLLPVLMLTIQAWVVKEVTRDKNEARLRTIFLAAVKVVGPLALGALTLTWLGSGWIGDFLRLKSPTSALIIGLYVVVSLVLPIPRGVLLGIGRLHAAGAVFLTDSAARVVAAVMLVSLGMGAAGALGGFVAGALAALCFAFVAVWGVLRRSQIEDRTHSYQLRLDSYALSALLINGFLMLLASVDQLAVKHFFSDEVAGNFAVAFLLGRITVLTTMSAGLIVFTRSAATAAVDPRRARMLVKGLAISGCTSLAQTAGYVANPDLVVRLIAGSQYSLAHDYVGLVGIEMTLFALIYVQTHYQISVARMDALAPLCVAVSVEFLMLRLYNSTVEQILYGLICVMAGLLAWTSLLSWRMLHSVEREDANGLHRPLP